MLKIFGIIVLLGSLLLLVVGVGGAVMNFVFPPEDLVCRMAEENLKKADTAVKRHQAAKGTADEESTKFAADLAIQSAQESSNSCGRMKDSYRFYGMIFSGVGVVGFVGVMLGAVLTFVGFRKRKIV